jgi:hypothetical protein
MDVMRARERADLRRRGAAAVPEEELARLAAGADSAEALGPIDPAAVRSEDLPGLGRAAGNRAVADLVANGRSGPAGGPPTMQLLPAARRGRVTLDEFLDDIRRHGYRVEEATD